MTQTTGIQDPTFGADVIDKDGWDLPEQIGSRRDPLQPGPYRATFPDAHRVRACLKDIEQEVLDVPGAKRIAAVHRDGAELTITQAPAPFRDRVGEAFPTRISNAERRRGKKDDPNTRTASDMDYVLMLCGVPGSKKPNAPKEEQRNAQYRDLYVQYVPGREIGFDIEYNWSCNAKRPIRVAVEGGGTEVLDGQDGRELRQGCGKKYYQRDVDRVANETTGQPEYPTQIQCECGATLYANENMSNFRR